MYRALMGMYMILAGLSFVERSRPSNIVPLTLGPHGADMEDIVSTLESFRRKLEHGVGVKINGKTIRLVAFVLAFVGDMPQQQANSGMNSQNAPWMSSVPCLTSTRLPTVATITRSCGCGTGVHGHNASYWTKRIQHIHRSACRCRNPSSRSIVLSRPSDPAHSELGGLTKLALQLFMETILETQARPSYNKMLRAFPFPPGLHFLYTQ